MTVLRWELWQSWWPDITSPGIHPPILSYPQEPLLLIQPLILSFPRNTDCPGLELARLEEASSVQVVQGFSHLSPVPVLYLPLLLPEANTVQLMAV